MTSRLDAVIASAMQTPGVLAAAVVNADGCAIENASCTEHGLEASSAVVNGWLRDWASVGTDLGIGAVRSVLIERADGPVTITPLGPIGALIIVANRTCRPGRLRSAVRRALGASESTSAVGQPKLGPGSERAIESAQSEAPVSTMAKVARNSNHRIGGEVVLAGPHTFRQVTKLVTLLLQAKGVRSSRLRAYSPISTVIDVVLEDGVTLAEIGSIDLKEFSPERPEEGSTRLVLRPAKALARSPASVGTAG